MGQRVYSIKAYYRDLVAVSLDRSRHYLPIGAKGLFSLLGVVTAASGLAVLLTAGYLKHPLDPGGMFTNFVSSLGWGENGSHEVFQVGLTLLTVMLIPYILFLIVTLRHHATEQTRQEIHELTHHSAGSWYIAAVGMCVLAWFVDIRAPNLDEAFLVLSIHGVGAALFFTFSVVGAIKLTQAMALHGMSSRIQQWLLRCIIFNAVAMAVSIVPLLVVSYNAGLFDDLLAIGIQFLITPEQRVGWIKTVTSNYPWVAFFEWGTAFSLMGWVGVTAIQTYRHPVLVNID